MEMRKIVECDMEKRSTLDNSEKTIAILRDRWWPQTAKEEGDKGQQFFITYFEVVHGKSVMSAQMLEVSLLGVETLLRLDRDAWSMAR